MIFGQNDGIAERLTRCGNRLNGREGDAMAFLIKTGQNKRAWDNGEPTSSRAVCSLKGTLIVLAGTGKGCKY